MFLHLQWGSVGSARIPGAFPDSVFRMSAQLNWLGLGHCPCQRFVVVTVWGLCQYSLDKYMKWISNLSIEPFLKWIWTLHQIVWENVFPVFFSLFKGLKYSCCFLKNCSSSFWSQDVFLCKHFLWSYKKYNSTLKKTQTLFSPQMRCFISEGRQVSLKFYILIHWSLFNKLFHVDLRS